MRDIYAPRLEELGDSVLVVGDQETLKVHVHTDDPDAAKSIFGGAGAIEREDIADMHEQIADHRLRLASGKSAVVAVVSGEGMRELFEDAGAIVIDGGPTLNPATNDLLRAIEACPADEVVVLPNSPNVILAAREAAELADKPVEVVDCESQQAGVLAVVAIKPELDAKANAARLAEELATVRTAAVAPAARDDVEGRFVRDDAVGFVGEEIVAWGETGVDAGGDDAADHRRGRDPCRLRGSGRADPGRRDRLARPAGSRGRGVRGRPAALLVADRLPVGARGYQPSVPASPLLAPTISSVIQPP